ncbi:MAG: FtsQ-type POTRA domain-containing protein [Acidobacteriota bacterium]|nr:FtsQ-type POTRA domain-containing protein [Acidobacteriota bacterium]MDH3522009.1 FtsQ-type POTRA domain-containing protein [Acidobacteriota bacterium]
MTVPGAAIERPPMFRRRRFEASHRRPSVARAILRSFGVAAAIVGIPAAVVFWVLTSPRFALRDLEIASGERVAAQWVADRLAPLRGRHVLLVSLPEIERLLATHRWVAGVEVHKRLPDALVVEVLERVPVAVLRRADGLYYVDRGGDLIDRLAQPEAPAALLLVEGDGGPAAVAAAIDAVERLAAGGSAVFEAVERVALLTGPDVELHATRLPFAVLVRVDRLQPAVATFERLLPKILRRYEGLQAVDLRFSKQIVIRFPEA